ncbi:putative NAD(P)-binding-domain-containing protein [Limtongia smithiae]|uniref:putative NAD(P)-binding-domain-containing protein n=1 Tax=Limtongia smithiae TaxID=1125753 RepID=UPI0034CF3894
MGTRDPPPPVPPIPGGASLIIAWQVSSRPVTVVGGGSVATGRVAHLLAADAIVTVICPPEGLSHTLQTRLARGEITHIPRVFDHEHDLSSAEMQPCMVLTAIDDASVSTSIAQACRALKIPVNVADVPPLCDFYFGSMYRDGPLQVMVSTNGNGPRMAALVRKRIESSLSEEPFGAAIERLGELRRRVREAWPGQDKDRVRARMSWVSQLSEKWTIAQLASLDDATIGILVASLGADCPPDYNDIVTQARLPQP